MKTFFILIGVAGLITIATLITIEKLEEDPPPSFKTGGIIVNPEKTVAQMQKRLGPEWEKIEMVQGKWYGPYKMKNGSDWKVAVGEVWIKVDSQRPFIDKPNTNPFVSGRKISFSPATNTATVFFSY